jgi:hypothetical protein
MFCSWWSTHHSLIISSLTLYSLDTDKASLNKLPTFKEANSFPNFLLTFFYGGTRKLHSKARITRLTKECLLVLPKLVVCCEATQVGWLYIQLPCLFLSPERPKYQGLGTLYADSLYIKTLWQSWSATWLHVWTRRLISLHFVLPQKWRRAFVV